MFLPLYQNLRKCSLGHNISHQIRFQLVKECERYIVTRDPVYTLITWQTLLLFLYLFVKSLRPLSDMSVSFRSHYPEWICNPVWQTSACNSVTSETFVLFKLNLKTWAWFSFEKVILQSFVNWALWLAIDIDSGSMPCLQTIASASCHSFLLEAAFVRKLHNVTCVMVACAAD